MPSVIEKRKRREIAVYDCETDPFKHGRVPQPFLWGFYDGKDFEYFHNTAEFVEFVRQKNVILYAHNGGKFDIHYLLDYAEPQTVKIINNRICSIKIGRAEFRDSYAIIPVPLSAYNKTKIDYEKFEADKRDAHMGEIIAYLQDDCIFTYEILSKYIQTLDGATKLTLASNAMHFAKKLGVDAGKTNKKFDEKFRADFYAGGRCQAFKKGEFENVNIYDINSAYPFAMKHRHAAGDSFYTYRDLLPEYESELCFYRFTAYSKGAFFKRQKSGALEFPHERGEFCATGRELYAAMATGAVEDVRIVECREFQGEINFSEYVDYWYRERKRWPKGTAENLIAKLFMNSLYGKMAQDAAKFEEYKLIDAGDDIPDGWILAAELPNHDVLSRPVEAHKRKMLLEKRGEDIYDFLPMYVNVATGASITGFVRAMLLREIARQPDKVLYCDTDSLFIRGEIGNLGGELGQWNFEGQAKKLYLCGKKLYAAKMLEGCDKIATKGAKLSFNDVVKISQGATVHWLSDAPAFSITKSMSKSVAEILHQKGIEKNAQKNLLHRAQFVDRKISMQK